MKTIPLTQGKVALVDDGDYDLLNQWKWLAWRSNRGRGVFYALRAARLKGKDIRMHNLILPPPPGMLVDHRDGDGLNNQRHNLRLATMSQNIAAAQFRPPASGFRGVYLHRISGRYNARIKVNQREKSLGYFETAIDAARAYDKAATMAWGEFARLNLPKQKGD